MIVKPQGSMKKGLTLEEAIAKQIEPNRKESVRRILCKRCSSVKENWKSEKMYWKFQDWLDEIINLLIL